MSIGQILLSQLPNLKLIAALVGSGGIVALCSALLTTIVLPHINYRLNKRLVRDRLETEYEYEQRKKLGDLIGSYHGRVLAAADLLKPTLLQLFGFSNLFQKVQAEVWLKVEENNYQAINPYFLRLVHRFLAVTTLVQRFEAEALYIDQRFAEGSDFDFLHYLKLLQKAATDMHLFEGVRLGDTEERISAATIRSDTLRVLTDSYWKGERYLNIQEFKRKVGKDPNLTPVLQFFANLKPEEDRLRWLRLLSFQFVMVGFINRFGYGYQETEEESLNKLLDKIDEPNVRGNLEGWFRDYELPFPTETSADR